VATTTPYPDTSHRFASCTTVWQLDVRQAEVDDLGEPEPCLQEQLDDGRVSWLMAHGTTKTLVLLLREVARLARFKIRRNNVRCRVACPKSCVLKELKEGANSCHLAPACVVGAGIPVKVSKEAFEMRPFHLLDYRHTTIAEVLGQLAEISEVFLSRAPSKVTACQIRVFISSERRSKRKWSIHPSQL
jgi:hypothetical protein